MKYKECTTLASSGNFNELTRCYRFIRRLFVTPVIQAIIVTFCALLFANAFKLHDFVNRIQNTHQRKENSADMGEHIGFMAICVVLNTIITGTSLLGTVYYIELVFSALKTVMAYSFGIAGIVALGYGSPTGALADNEVIQSSESFFPVFLLCLFCFDGMTRVSKIQCRFKHVAMVLKWASLFFAFSFAFLFPFANVTIFKSMSLSQLQNAGVTVFSEVLRVYFDSQSWSCAFDIFIGLILFEWARAIALSSRFGNMGDNLEREAIMGMDYFLLFVPSILCCIFVNITGWLWSFFLTVLYLGVILTGAHCLTFCKQFGDDLGNIFAMIFLTLKSIGVLFLMWYSNEVCFLYACVCFLGYFGICAILPIFCKKTHTEVITSDDASVGSVSDVE